MIILVLAISIYIGRRGRLALLLTAVVILGLTILNSLMFYGLLRA